MGYVYMASALVCWTALAFAYRWAERAKANRLYMSAAIGASAVLWALVFSFMGGLDLAGTGRGQIIVACIAGVGFVAVIPVFLAAVARGDIAISWMLLTLSFAFASALMMIYPGERPTLMSLTGLSLVAGAVVLLGLDMRERHRTNHPRKPKKGWILFMSLSFVGNGLSQYAFKLATSLRGDELPAAASLAQNVGYLFFFYATVLTVGLTAALVFSRRRPHPATLWSGATIGTLLFLGGLAVLQALSVGRVPGHVFFPATSGGSSILVVVISVIVLKEPPGRFGWAGIILGAAALTILGLAA